MWLIIYNACCLSRYCTVYKLLVILDKLHVLVTNCELLVTHINQLVNFTVKLGEDKETVLANRNYTKPPAGQSEGHTDPHPRLGWVRWLLTPPPYPHQRGQLRERGQRAVLNNPWQRRNVMSHSGFPSLADKKRLCLRSTGAEWQVSYWGGP